MSEMMREQSCYNLHWFFSF